jgi:outer membrane protein TolC
MATSPPLQSVNPRPPKPVHSPRRPAVPVAFVGLTQTETRTEQLQGEVTSLTRARDLSQQSYASGVIPLTDVLDADRQLLAAQDDLARSRADAARAAVRSFRALGGGWSAEPAAGTKAVSTNPSAAAAD